MVFCTLLHVILSLLTLRSAVFVRFYVSGLYSEMRGEHPRELRAVGETAKHSRLRAGRIARFENCFRTQKALADNRFLRRYSELVFENVAEVLVAVTAALGKRT